MVAPDSIISHISRTNICNVIKSYLHLFIQSIEAACIIGETGDLISMS